MQLIQREALGGSHLRNQRSGAPCNRVLLSVAQLRDVELRRKAIGSQPCAFPGSFFVPLSSLKSCCSLLVCRASATEAALGSPVLHPGKCLTRFTLEYQVQFGEVVKLVGSSEELGNWRADSAPVLTWSAGNIWSADVPMVPGMYEFKAVIYNQQTRRATWEEGDGNRQMEVPAASGMLLVPCTWEDLNMDTTYITNSEAISDYGATLAPLPSSPSSPGGTPKPSRNFRAPTPSSSRTPLFSSSHEHSISTTGSSSSSGNGGGGGGGTRALSPKPSREVEGTRQRGFTPMPGRATSSGPFRGKPVKPGCMRLYVANVPYETQTEELAGYLMQVGKVHETVLLRDRFTKLSRGIAFVEMESSAARLALEKLHGADFCGRPLVVEPARDPNDTSTYTRRPFPGTNGPPTSRPGTPRGARVGTPQGSRNGSEGRRGTPRPSRGTPTASRARAGTPTGSRGTPTGSRSRGNLDRDGRRD